MVLLMEQNKKDDKPIKSIDDTDFKCSVDRLSKFKDIKEVEENKKVRELEAKLEELKKGNGKKVVKSSLTFTDFFPDIHFHNDFENPFKKVEDSEVNLEIKKLIKKIICDPVRQKHVQYSRKGLQKEYIDSYCLYFSYSEKEKTIYFVELSLKDDQ
jgi:hypothetical protein